jgi:capsular exopolysaccharide synthesis family protein
MSNNSSSSEDNLFSFLLNKYLPFWPLFAVLLALAGAVAWGYLHHMAVPVYEASATIIVKDTKKGVEESRMTRSMDAFLSTNIVENEIKVMQSRSSLLHVVQELGLYAPVFEEKPYKSVPAYTSSPIRITLQETGKIKETEKVYFSFDAGQKTVTINNTRYPLGQWVKTPYGVMQFTRNDKQKQAAEGPLYFSLRTLKQATTDLAGKLTIQTENKLSTAVSLTLRDTVPERAEDVLNQLLQAYNQVGIDNRNKLAANTLAFVENRIKLVGRELENLEKQVVRYKSSKGVVDLSEQGKVYLSNVGANERNLTDINLQLAVLDKVDKYTASRSATQSMAPSTLGIQDPVLEQLLQRLYESEVQYQKLKATTAENNPILLSVTDEIDNTRRSIQENIQNQKVALQTSRARLLATRNQYNSALQTIPQKERDLVDISRQQASKNEAFRFLLQKREEAVLSLAPSAEDTNFVDLAQASVTPVSPQPMYLYVLALLGACAAGVAFVSGKELLTSKILFRSEIQENTSIPIVGELSYLKQPQGERFQEPTAAFIIEQFRQLRVTLGLYGRFFLKKKIVVTSNIPGEGKSFVSTHLAYSLAASGRKVALIDFDLRNPHTSRLFDLYKQKGITEYLMDEMELYEGVYPTAFNNLYVVPAGVKVGDNTELLLNGKLEAFFARLEKEFDYLILDTPPIDLVSDAYLLSEFSDITLLVMRHAYTPKRIVQRLNQNKKVQSMHHPAIVFNGVKSRGFVRQHYGYGYGYGHENNYGAKTYMAQDFEPKTKTS